MEPTNSGAKLVDRLQRERAARAFTETVMRLAAEWDGCDKGPLLEYLQKDIDLAISSCIGREQLRTLVENFLDGQVPHFGEVAATIIGQEPPRRREMPLPDNPVHTEAHACGRGR